MKVVSLISRDWSYEITKRLIKENDRTIDFCLLITKKIVINKDKYNHIKIKKKLNHFHLT